MHPHVIVYHYPQMEGRKLYVSGPWPSKEQAQEVLEILAKRAEVMQTQIPPDPVVRVNETVVEVYDAERNCVKHYEVVPLIPRQEFKEVS